MLYNLSSSQIKRLHLRLWVAGCGWPVESRHDSKLSKLVARQKKSHMNVLFYLMSKGSNFSRLAAVAGAGAGKGFALSWDHKVRN